MDRTIVVTDEEIDATLPQIESRLEDLKKLAIETTDFNRMMELVPFIGHIQSFHDKMQEERFRL